MKRTYLSLAMLLCGVGYAVPTWAASQQTYGQRKGGSRRFPIPR